MFEDRLALDLTLAIDGHTHEVPGGAIEQFRVDARPWGFSAEVVFHVSCEAVPDTLFPAFVTRSPIEARLAFRGCEHDEPVSEPITLVLQGLVQDKSHREVVGAKIAGQPVQRRRYTIRFADPATVLWTQHRPCDLFTATSLEKVIEAHSPKGVTVRCDADALSEKRDLICLALGQDEGGASFYDFVVWLMAGQRGVFELDYLAGGYVLAQRKRKVARPAVLGAADIAASALRVPPSVRASARVLNAFAERPQTKTLANDLAVQGVRRDALVRSALPTRVERRAQLEASRLLSPDPQLELTLAQLPRIPFHPGQVVTLDGLSDRLFSAGKPHRLLQVTLAGKAREDLNATEGALDDRSADYAIELRARLEPASERTAELPPFREPRYPLRVEGRVLSTPSADDDRTWLALESEQTSLNFQLVEVPLWNKKVMVPFEPNRAPGHFFFPPYKNARVLLALDFDGARISRHLDWPSDGRPPQTTQGNQLSLGRTAKNGTLVRHVYRDGKPVLAIDRTCGPDQQKLEVHEGGLSLHVEEKKTAAALEPRYDVTLQVEAAKGALVAAVGSGVTRVTGTFQTASGGVTASIETALAELDGTLVTMETELFGRIESVQAELEMLAESVASSVGRIAATVASAKGEIMAALME